MIEQDYDGLTPPQHTYTQPANPPPLRRLLPLAAGPSVTPVASAHFPVDSYFMFILHFRSFYFKTRRS